MCEALWMELRRTLEDYIISCLYQLPNTDTSLLVKQKRSDYVEYLDLLTAKRHLCQQYRSGHVTSCGLNNSLLSAAAVMWLTCFRLLRVCSLNQLINEELSSEGDAAAFPQIVNAFERILGQVKYMINNDYHLLSSGIFRQVRYLTRLLMSLTESGVLWW
mgnify:CR=1 FL=1